MERSILQNSGSTDNAKDIFQESFLVMWSNVKSGKFLPANIEAIGGYLFKVAKNKWIDQLRSMKRKKTVSMTEYANLETDQDLEEVDSEKISSAMQAFNQLDAGCKNLLKSFYFEKCSLQEIASQFEIDTASARTKKYRCMQKIRSIVLKPREK